MLAKQRFLIKLILIFLCSQGLYSQTPELLIDIIDNDNSSGYPQNITVVEDKVYFTAYDKQHGRELWISDGSKDGTYLVKDIIKGSLSSEVSHLTSLNGKLYFLVTSEINNIDLWESDGTSEGTRYLQTVRVSAQNSYFIRMLAFNENIVIFDNVDIKVHYVISGELKNIGSWGKMGRELYSKVKIIGDKLYFNSGGLKYLDKDFKVVNAHFISTAKNEIVDYNIYGNELVYLGHGYEGAGLYISSVDTNNAEFISPAYVNNSTFYKVGDRIIYLGIDSNYGVELFYYDIITKEKGVVKDIKLGSESGVVYYYGMFNDKLYFYADDGNTGYELWYTDGTKEGTRLLKNIAPDKESSAIYYDIKNREFLEYNGFGYFFARNGGKTELWKTDGTEIGTTPVAIDEDFSSVNTFRRCKDLIYFSGSFKDINIELGVYSFKENMFKEPVNLDASSNSLPLGFKSNNKGLISYKWQYKKNLSFRYKDVISVIGEESESLADSIQFHYTEFKSIDDGFVFRIERKDESNLWYTNLSSGGTKRIENSKLTHNYHNSNHHDIFVYNNKPYFLTDGESGSTRKLCMIDDNKSVKEVANVEMPNWSYLKVSLVNKYLVFVSGKGNELSVKSVLLPDGEIKAILNDDSKDYSFVNILSEAKNKLYFSSIDELWVTDGTPNGTKKLLSGIYFNINSSEDFISGENYNDKFYFRAYSSGSNNNNNLELWVTDGTTEGTKMLKDIREGDLGSFPDNYIVYKDKLYFTAITDVHGDELWVSDGTPEGTKLFMDINPGKESSSIDNLRVIDNTLLFTANHKDYGREAWMTLGRVSNTKLVYDLIPGEESSNPYNYIKSGDDVVFGAYTDETGVELFHMGQELITSLDNQTAKNKNNIDVFPNPFTDYIQIRNNNSSLIQYQLFTVDGKMIERNVSNKRGVVSLNYLKAGSYIIKLKDGNRIYSKIIYKL